MKHVITLEITLEYEGLSADAVREFIIQSQILAMWQIKVEQVKVLREIRQTESKET